MNNMAFWLLPVLPVLALWIFEQWNTARQRRERLRAFGSGTSTVKLDWRRQASRLTVGLASPKERERLQRLLESAGYHASWQLDAFLLSKMGLLLVAGLFVIWWQEIDSFKVLLSPGPMFKALFVLYLAVRIPDWLLNDKAKQRQQRIRSTVPQALDLLTICAEAGLSLDEALLRVAAEIEYAAPEIASEFRITRSELLVLSDRSEALRRMAERSGVRELELLAGTLIQSMRYGTPLASALQMIASESRARQLAELEEKAGSIAARVGVPLIVMVLFPLVVLMAAPAVISLIETLGKSAGK